MKPLSKWTLEEVKEYCKSRGRELGCCRRCKLMEICVIKKIPEDWYFPEENDVPAASDTNAADKPTKPRLAEVLGVEEDEEWNYPGFSELQRIHNGIRQYRDDKGTWNDCHREERLTEIINHPESIIRAPRLTEAELERCRVHGVKYLTRDKDSAYVALHAEKAMILSPGYYGEEAYIGHVDAALFPSVKCGDCICVEEAGGK